MTTTVKPRRGVAPASVETEFAELLAQVLRVDQVPADAHFFENLGADSLVMAHFCARVRKRGDLPSVSMKDIYAHPTVARLAAALADGEQSAARPAATAAPEATTVTVPRRHRRFHLMGR